MRLLVRSWNIFHGRTFPETGTPDPEAAVRLISQGEPDIVCLQEVPVWALPLLEAWSGMAAHSTVTMVSLGGSLARRLTALRPRLLRSALTGQANAVLSARRLRVEGAEALRLNPRSVRREGRREGLALDARLHWWRNRRVAQFVRVRGAEGAFLVVNLHLTGHRDSRPAERELLRALAHAERLVPAPGPILLCGDLNLAPARSAVLRDVQGLGFTAPLQGIDQIVTRGLAFLRGPELWPEDRRARAGRLLSDHAPVEAELATA